MGRITVDLNDEDEATFRKIAKQESYTLKALLKKMLQKYIKDKEKQNV